MRDQSILHVGWRTNGERLTGTVSKDQPLMIDVIDSPCVRIESLKQEIYKRGL